MRPSFFVVSRGLVDVANRKRFAEYWKESENKYPIRFVLRGGSGMIHDAHLLRLRGEARGGRNRPEEILNVRRDHGTTFTREKETQIRPYRLSDCAHDRPSLRVWPGYGVFGELLLRAKHRVRRLRRLLLYSKAGGLSSRRFSDDASDFPRGLSKAGAL